MSTRTKSFFDQNNQQKRPGQWHRYPNKQPLGESSSNKPAPLPPPPIPATSQAKQKLKAFQFVPNDRDEPVAGEDKENTTAAHPSNTTQAPREASLADTVPNTEDVPPTEHTMTAAPPPLPHANTFPSTPGARLSLEDLIGNHDENAKGGNKENESPEEFIGWIPNSSSTLLTPNRKRKRARSSSPSSCANTSSQRGEASAFFPAAAAPGDKAPEADPTADLWQQYQRGKQDGDAKRPDISHLLFQASPRALETPVRSTGFRRWASTGNDWPTSKSKRRKPNGQTSINMLKEAAAAETGEKSKFADMLKKVEDSLATQKLAKDRSKPAVRVEGPSSSSPLPETGGKDVFNALPSASPLETKQVAQLLSKVQDATTKPLAKVGGNVEEQPQCNEATYEANNVNLAPSVQIAAATSTPLFLQSKAPLPAYKRPSIVRKPSHEKQSTQMPPPPPPAAVTKAADAEEFGDDFDLSVEDLEEITGQDHPLEQRSLYQIPPHPNPPPHNHEPTMPPVPVQGTVAAGCAAQPIYLNDDFDVEDNDEFGMGDIDEASFAQAEMSATEAVRMSPPKRSSQHATGQMKSDTLSASLQANSSNNLQRYVVKQVVEGEYTDDRGRRCPETLLITEEERTSRTAAITLRGSWIATSIHVGNTVHVADLRRSSAAELPSPPPGQFTISDSEYSPLLIVHPDHMLSATTVADSFDCIRKAVLQDRIKATGDTNKSMVYGKILHEIFQQALSANQWSSDFLSQLVERTVQSHVESLWELGMADTVLAVEEITAKMAELASWARIFVADTPSEVALVDDRQGEQVWMSVGKLIAIEEHIWSPRYGLKGNIDATVQTTLIDHPKEAGQRLIAPFEVKTGRTTQSPAHRAQTALYTLLLSDRYDVSVTAGVLYYLESSAMSRIAPPMNEIRQMVQQRNRLAAYLHRARHPADDAQVQVKGPQQTQEVEDSGLPKLLKNPFKCGRCYAQQSCFSYHALIEDGSADSAGMIDDGRKNHALIWQEAVGHLQLTGKDRTHAETLKQWFAKWDRLLTFEESNLNRLRRELWTMSSSEREANGRCFGSLLIEHDLTSTAANATPSIVDGIEGGGGKINRFAYTFTNAAKKPGHSFILSTQLNVGEPIVVSSESGQWALANGYVVAATKHNITVAVDRRLGNARQRQADFDAERNQSFIGIMNVGDDDGVKPLDGSPALYRLDKDEFSNGLALVRNNLVTMMSSHPIHTKLRSQVVLDSKPTLLPSQALPTLAPSQLGQMNEDQQAAVSKVLSAEDYALILGMPGTGKTTTIAHIIRALLAEGKSILLASFTHTAVDNILLKIRDIAPPDSIIRIGVPAKINAQVQEFCQLAATPRKTIDEVETAYMGCRIVASTCMATNHPIFNRRAFDVCIVDEASQITLPTSLGPLLRARKFVLVGDHYQLPPLVQNRQALEGGLDVSLFRQLSEKHPEAMATLGKQYRMCEDIMSLSNALIYNGSLRCGNEEIANRTLKVGSMEALSAFHTGSSACADRVDCWVEDLARPSRKVVFANTDLAGKAALETLTVGKNITNQLEAMLVAQLVLALLALGVPESDIGVITLYRSQLALIRQLFKKAGISPNVEIDSADRFQGRDKECIILSMVRSNESGTVGDLLKDWRRVNVALTRARSKLVVLGSRRTLRNNSLLARFLALVDERGWSMDLPKDADTCHTFSFSSQAASDLVAQSVDSPTQSQCTPAMKKTVAAVDHSPEPSGTSRTALKESPDASNRGLKRSGLSKQPGKVISGRGSQFTSQAKRALEQMSFDIFEDLNADDF